MMRFFDLEKQNLATIQKIRTILDQIQLEKSIDAMESGVQAIKDECRGNDFTHLENLRTQLVRLSMMEFHLAKIRDKMTEDACGDSDQEDEFPVAAGSRTRKRKWRPEEEAELVKLRSNGLKVKDIAKTLGRSKASILEKIQEKRDVIEIPGTRVPVSASAPVSAPLPVSHTPNTDKNWSDADSKMVRDMFAKKCTDMEIASAVGRTQNAIRVHRQTLGLRKGREEWPRNGGRKPGSRTWSDAEERKLRELFKAGHTDEVIASEMGRGKANSIAKKRLRLGLSHQGESGGATDNSMDVVSDPESNSNYKPPPRNVEEYLLSAVK
jgi:hypothetical protein